MDHEKCGVFGTGHQKKLSQEYICSEDLKYTRLSLVLLHYRQFFIKRCCGGLEYDWHLWHCLLLLFLLHLTQFLPLRKGTLVRWFMLWRLVLGASETWNNFGWDCDKYSSWMKVRRDYHIIKSVSKYDDMYMNSIKINYSIQFFLHDVPPLSNWSHPICILKLHFQSISLKLITWKFSRTFKGEFSH